MTAYAPYCTHTLTLQMNLPTCNANAERMEHLFERALRTTKQFRRRLAIAAFGNGAIRKPDLYHPLMLATVEGKLNTYDKNKTLHTHTAIGNIITPTSRIKSEEQLVEVVKECWLRTDEGVDDIVVKEFNSTGWISYITKELDKGNLECIDWGCTYVPFNALLD